MVPGFFLSTVLPALLKGGAKAVASRQAAKAQKLQEEAAQREEMMRGGGGRERTAPTEMFRHSEPMKYGLGGIVGSGMGGMAGMAGRAITALPGGAGPSRVSVGNPYGGYRTEQAYTQNGGVPYNAGIGSFGGMRGRWQDRRLAKQQRQADRRGVPLPNVVQDRIDARNYGEGTPYTLGNPVFPGASYRPGIDPEFDYFPKYAEGGMVEPNLMAAAVAPSGAPRSGIANGLPEDKQLVEMAIQAIQGGAPNPQLILQAFVARFGQEALADLMNRVQGGSGGLTEGSGGLTEGAGDGMSDEIPAMQPDGPARLSDGEFVVPSDVVSGIGNGSTSAGANELQQMLSRVRGERSSGRQPPPINPGRMMPA